MLLLSTALKYSEEEYSMRALASEFNDYDYRIHDIDCIATTQDNQPVKQRSQNSTISFEIMPNPSSGIVTISFNDMRFIKRLVIQDVFGNNYFDSAPLDSEIVVELEHSGLYIVNSFSEDGAIKTKKIIIAK